MSITFKDSNFLVDTKDLVSVQQYVFNYQPGIQYLKLNNAEKIVLHCWGGGGGGGTSFNGTGSGGGGSFTILDFPYYPIDTDVFIEVQVGKGGSGGFYTGTIGSSYVPAQNGENTTVLYKNVAGRVLKEFISYGGKAGAGNQPFNSGNGPLLAGGDPGGNSLVNNLGNPLMGAYFYKNNASQIPRGGGFTGTAGTGTAGTQLTGDHCQINYMNVTAGGGGANIPRGQRNDGGSFLLNKGGLGGNSLNFPVYGGGGGSTYYGKGGDGLTSLTNPNGTNGETDSGAGGGGAGMINSSNNFTKRGGNGGNGMVIIEYYN